MVRARFMTLGLLGLQRIRNWIALGGDTETQCYDGACESQNNAACCA